MEEIRLHDYPFGKAFAVAFVDDTDWADLGRLLPVYRLFDAYGVCVTKTVWPLPVASPSGNVPSSPGFEKAATLQDRSYRLFCQSLQARGHEIALHTASGGDNTRDRTIAGYRLFEDTFGQTASVNVMHGRNRENIYWGRDIFPGTICRALVSAYEPQRFSGHIDRSEYFWGDVCFEKTKYVRLLETSALNTLSVDPATPFHDPAKPYVRRWFSSTYAAGSEYFRLITRARLEQLRKERGAAILHTYCVQFSQGDGFGGYLPSQTFRRSLEVLAGFSDGWYVGVTELLDRLAAVRRVAVRQRGRSVTLENRSDSCIPEMAFIVPPNVAVVDEMDRNLCHRRNAAGQVPLGHLMAGESRTLALVSTESVRVAARPQHSPNYAAMFVASTARMARTWSQGSFVPALTKAPLNGRLAIRFRA